MCLEASTVVVALVTDAVGWIIFQTKANLTVVLFLLSIPTEGLHWNDYILFAETFDYH